MAYLPNKKILFLIVFILLIFAGWFYFSGYKNRQTQYIAEKEKSPLTVVPEHTNSLASTTSDWLLTLPQNNSSDREDVLAKTNQSLEGASDTLTASYAKQFLTNYLLLKQTKGDLTQEDKQNLVDATMKDIKPLATADKYAISDLKISNYTSKESIKKYSDEIKKIFIDTEHVFVDNNIVFEKLLEKIKNKEENYDKDIFALNYSAGMYVWIANQLAILTDIPNNLAKKHLEMINGFYNTAVALETMAQVVTDPIKGMIAQSFYENQLKKNFDLINDIQKTFDEYGISVF